MQQRIRSRREHIAGLSFDELLERKQGIVPFILETVNNNAQELRVVAPATGILSFDLMSKDHEPGFTYTQKRL